MFESLEMFTDPGKIISADFAAGVEIEIVILGVTFVSVLSSALTGITDVDLTTLGVFVAVVALDEIVFDTFGEPAAAEVDADDICFPDDGRDVLEMFLFVVVEFPVEFLRNKSSGSVTGAIS